MAEKPEKVALKGSLGYLFSKKVKKIALILKKHLNLDNKSDKILWCI